MAASDDTFCHFYFIFHGINDLVFDILLLELLTIFAGSSIVFPVNFVVCHAIKGFISQQTQSC